MNKLLISILTLLFSLSLNAQRYEFGIYSGIDKVVGDIGPGYFLGYDGFSAGAVFKWNRTKSTTIRFDLRYHNVSDSGQVPYEYNNAYSYSNSLITFESMLEWNFFDYKPKYPGESTPFLNVGLGYIANLNNLTFPFGIGYKMLISPHLVLAAELTFRYTASDELDKTDVGVVGNVNSNDWLNTFGLTLTYSFGRDPCPCGQ